MTMTKKLSKNNKILFIDEQDAEGVYIIHLAGELNDCSTDLLEDRFKELLETVKTPTTFVLDCKNLRYLDSSGVSTIIYFTQKLKELHSTVRVCQMQPNVFEFFQRLGFTKIFNYRETLVEVLQEVFNKQEATECKH